MPRMMILTIAVLLLSSCGGNDRSDTVFILSTSVKVGKIDKTLESLLTRNEEFRSKPYKDGRGVSVGIGRDLTTEGLSVGELYEIFETIDTPFILMNCSVSRAHVYVHSVEDAKKMFGDGLSKDAALFLLANDVDRVVWEAKQLFPKWNTIEKPRQHAIIDCLYNLGLPHFELFKKFIAAVHARDWDEAAKQLSDSAVARSKENRERYKRNSEVIRTGDAAHFSLTDG